MAIAYGGKDFEKREILRQVENATRNANKLSIGSEYDDGEELGDYDGSD